MCGIFFSYGQDKHECLSDQVRECLERRGPDSACLLKRAVNSEYTSSDHIPPGAANCLTFFSTVLSLRGGAIATQPLEDPGTGSLLCWNGEAWMVGEEVVDGNDSQIVFDLFLKAVQSCNRSCGNVTSSDDKGVRNIINAISSISGPYAFVFYDAPHQRVFYGRDILGRRSLAVGNDHSGAISISSLCECTDSASWTEVEADGIYMLDLRAASRPSNEEAEIITSIPRLPHASTTKLQYAMISPFPLFNHDSEFSGSPSLTLDSPAVDRLLQKLQASMALRIQNVPLPPLGTPDTARVAILFSGGLDCTVLARLTHEILPEEQAIDLLNVAFENPRVVQAAARGTCSAEFSAYGKCPDRSTGLTSFAELQLNCPGRIWRFVAIDVSYVELQDHRSKIISLIYPHNTEMDFSIACALYFAARGSGVISEPSTGSYIAYKTPARVLLSGLGADELFGGYTRHASAFRRRGFTGLVDELQLDFNRLGKRNLGRDDRVISHWGKEVRYPYLDEALVGWALSIPVWEKCGFGHSIPDEGGPSMLIEPGKKLLRLVAWTLGLQGAAVEKKRAIQFGARTAKMEAGKTKGTQILS